MSVTLSSEPNGSFNDAGLQFVWDATSISMAQECPRKYQLSMLEHWRGKNESVHLWFGKHFASVLEMYYKELTAGIPRDEAIRNGVMFLLTETWNSETKAPDTFTDTAKTRETLVRTFVWYVDHYEHDTMELWVTPTGQAAVEHSFVLPINAELFFAGHLDRVVTYNGDRYGMDQKTSKSAITPHFMKQFALTNQMSMYTWAGQIVYDIQLKGIVIDGVQVAVGFNQFHRGFTLRHQKQLDEWLDDSLMTIDQIHQYTKDQYFPMNRTSCNNYGGCMFREVCSRHPANRKQFLKADYVQTHQWDPSCAR